MTLLKHGAAAALFLMAMPCHAALAESGASIDVDRTQMNATLRVERRPHYTIYHLEAPAEMHVREYVSDRNQVFGVAWDGPVKPDLHRLLGASFDRFAFERARMVHAGRSQVGIVRADIIIESVGHVRSFQGRAVARDLLPEGSDASLVR